MTPIIDFADVATDLQQVLTTAITAIVPVAVALLGATIGWRYLRRFLGR
jgi:type III secretory pathway component EscT